MKKKLYPLLKVKVKPNGFFFPADSAKPVPFAVVSLDSILGQWESRYSSHIMRVTN